MKGGGTKLRRPGPDLGRKLLHMVPLSALDSSIFVPEAKLFHLTTLQD